MTVMPSRLDSRSAWAALALVAVSASVDAALFALYDTHPSRESEALWTMLFNSAWSWWVYVDRRQHRLGYPFGFDALVFFAWPLVAPYYLLRSRANRSRRATWLIWLLYALPFLMVSAWVRA